MNIETKEQNQVELSRLLTEVKAYIIIREFLKDNTIPKYDGQSTGELATILINSLTGKHE